MIKIKKKQNIIREEEKKEEGASGTGEVKKVKKAPGELRLQKELTELDSPSHAKVDFGTDGNIMSFHMTVDLTNEESIWKGGRYKFSIVVPPTYPHDPPKCMCLTQIYHPNIDLQGNVCLNILRGDWKPVLGVNAVILGLIFLFIEPNDLDPLNHEAAEVMRANKNNFQNVVTRTLRGGVYENINYEKFI